jgi:hypothetical protein
MPGNQSRINVEQSTRVAKGDFDYIDRIDYGEFGEGRCAEGHPIRYGYEFRSRSTGESVILGGDCQWKVYLFRAWENLQAEQITSELIKIGKLFWNIEKDRYWNDIREIMRRTNVRMDFSVIPSPGEQRAYRLQLRDLLGKAISQRKAREKAEKERRKRERTHSSRKEEESRLRQRQALSDEDVANLNATACPLTSSCDDETVRKSLLDSYIKYGHWTDSQRGLARNLAEKCKDDDYIGLCTCSCSRSDEAPRKNLILQRRKSSWNDDERSLAKKIIERNTPIEMEEDFDLKKEILLSMMRSIASMSPREGEKNFLIDIHDLIDDGTPLKPRQMGWLIGIIDDFQRRTGGAITFDTHEFIKKLSD